MKIGFTGTSGGMTDAQFDSLELLLDGPDIFELHHGDCVGADEQVHDLVLEEFDNFAKIVIYPPSNPKKRAFCFVKEGERMRVMFDRIEQLPPRPYLDRNHDIVDATDILIATPDGTEERVRSGTWATVRYAWKKGKKVVMIYPNGQYAVFHGFENVV